MKKNSILIERTFKVPASKIWKALTNHDELKKWYFEVGSFELKVGAKFNFMGGPDEESQYLHLCEVTEIIENEKIVHSWRYDNYPGNSYVTWELIAKGKKTMVKLIHTDFHTLAEGEPIFAKENFVAGWKYILHTSLKNYLETKLE